MNVDKSRISINNEFANHFYKQYLQAISSSANCVEYQGITINILHLSKQRICLLTNYLLLSCYVHCLTDTYLKCKLLYKYCLSYFRVGQ